MSNVENPIYYLAYPFNRVPLLTPWNPLLTFAPSGRRAARCAVEAIQPHKRRSIAAWGTRSVLTACLVPQSGTLPAPPAVANRTGAPKPALATEWKGRKYRPGQTAHAHIRARTQTGPRALALHPIGVLGNTTLPVALAAGFGGAFACSLVVIILILRRRRSNRAIDPTPSLRTLLYV